MNKSTGWTQVGRLADVGSILATIGGLLTIALALFGGSVSARTWFILSAAIGFGVVGLIAIGTAMMRNLLPGAGLRMDGRATTRTLNLVGVVLLLLAMGSVLLLVVHPAGVCTGV